MRYRSTQGGGNFTKRNNASRRGLTPLQCSPCPPVPLPAHWAELAASGIAPDVAALQLREAGL